MEFMKYLAPLIGVVLGALIAPWVEQRKRSYDLKHKLETLYLEISDLKTDAEHMLEIAYETYSKSYLAEYLGLDNEYTKNYSIPRTINFYSLDETLLEVYSSLTYDQRNAIKSIFEIANFINQKVELLAKSSDGNAKNLDQLTARSIVNTLATLIYLTSRLHHESDRFVYFKDLKDKDVIASTLSAYDYSLEFDDIIKKYKYKQEQLASEKALTNQASEMQKSCTLS
ncbi:hypothetical protein ACG1BZ_05715 [Microbulbifer sp. CNSA002]|uniref:hypothetical protein n=1 Tax=Microbulbifer sp. CNSA002 TaxID=3373604 RepID=UPI0039B38DE5